MNYNFAKLNKYILLELHYYKLYASSYQNEEFMWLMTTEAS